MSLFKRHPQPLSEDIDENDPIDPNLRLRTVRTAASTIAESIRSEIRAEKRRSIYQKRSFFRRNANKKASKPTEAASSDTPSVPNTRIPGDRRNVYVNYPLSAMEVDQHGEPLARYARNKVRTSSTSCIPLSISLQRYLLLIGYTLLTFLPKNLFEQFHRCVLLLMKIQSP
jgi:phospholipid-translocating ATPase